MRVVWTRPALRDLEAIGDHLARDNRRAADRIVKRIRDRTRDLTNYPLLGRIGRVAGTRELVIPDTRFIVVYASATIGSRFSPSFTPRAAGRIRFDAWRLI